MLNKKYKSKLVETTYLLPLKDKLIIKEGIVITGWQEIKARQCVSTPVINFLSQYVRSYVICTINIYDVDITTYG